MAKFSEEDWDLFEAGLGPDPRGEDWDSGCGCFLLLVIGLLAFTMCSVVMR